MHPINRRHVLQLLGATATLGLSRPVFARYGEEEGLPRRTFVLIHGAWHGGFAWNGVARRLRQRGHTVVSPTLPGMRPGDNRGGIRFTDYVEAVVEVLQQQDRQVILVGHSSAGMLLQAAAPYAAEKIALLVFSNAFVVANGQNQLDNIPADAAAGLRALAQSTPDNTVPFEPLEGFIRTALMVGDPIQRQNALLQRLLAQPFSLFSTPVDTTPFEALRIPRAMLFCVRDRSADYPGMATRLRDYRVVTADGSHEMLFADPAGYTRALLTLLTPTHSAV